MPPKTAYFSKLSSIRILQRTIPSKEKCCSGYYDFGCCTVAAQSLQSESWESLVSGYLQEI